MPFELWAWMGPMNHVHIGATRNLANTSLLLGCMLYLCYLGYGLLLQMEKRDLSVDLSACWSTCHNRELCKNGWTDRDVVWYVDSGGSKEACIRRLTDRVVTCCTQDKATTTSQPFVIPLLSTVRQPTRPHITATVVFVISRSLNSRAYPTGYKLKETYTPKIAKIGPNSWCRICR